MKLTGNVVTPDNVFYGNVECDNSLIVNMQEMGPFRKDEPWILAGFIDLHFHGLGQYPVDTEADLRGICKYAVEKGTTRLCPTLSCMPVDFTVEWLKTVRYLVKEQPEGAVIAGSHLEGPWLSIPFMGGMPENMIRKPDLSEAQQYLDAADGTLRLLTIAPEGKGALEIIRLMTANQVTVSLGHSACPAEFFEQAVAAGITQICHLFDSFALPADNGGVRQPAITDIALINDNLMKEIIMDGLHVPPDLVILARRAAGADHIIAITDALQGAGLPFGRFFDTGRPYIIRDDDLGRLEENGQIVGSALTMNRAFFNMTTRFGFSPIEASRALSANPARQLKLNNTGILEIGYLADITMLEPDNLTVRNCFVNGKKIFSK